MNESIELISLAELIEQVKAQVVARREKGEGGKAIARGPERGTGEIA